MQYHAFLSYSHAADAELSAAVHANLQRLAKPWYRLRSIRVFRDTASLSANPALWSALEAALAASQYFLLMASPRAAGSPWVQRELQWWLARREPNKILILVTAGDLVWDEAGGDFNWNKTTALPPGLKGGFKEEPLYVDLRWASGRTDLSLRHGRFRAAVLDIAATLRQVPKDDLDGQDVRERGHLPVCAR